MKLFLFIVVIYLELLLTSQRPQVESSILTSLPTPVLYRYNYLPNGFVWEWQPVRSDKANPILGFKLKVWALKKTKIYTKQETVADGTLVTEYMDVDYDTITDLPSYEPLFVKYAYGADATSARIYGTEPGVYYQFRVQAYSEAGDGPLSEPICVRLVSKITTTHQ